MISCYSSPRYRYMVELEDKTATLAPAIVIKGTRTDPSCLPIATILHTVNGSEHAPFSLSNKRISTQHSATIKTRLHVECLHSLSEKSDCNIVLLPCMQVFVYLFDQEGRGRQCNSHLPLPNPQTCTYTSSTFTLLILLLDHPQHFYTRTSLHIRKCSQPMHLIHIHLLNFNSNSNNASPTPPPLLSFFSSPPQPSPKTRSPCPAALRSTLPVSLRASTSFATCRTVCVRSSIASIRWRWMRGISILYVISLSFFSVLMWYGIVWYNVVR